MRSNGKVYLDWAATAPLCPEAREAMDPFLTPGLSNMDFGANANSLHSSGRRAFSALEEARLMISRSLGASRPDEIIFTSGATEADNAAILGIVSALRKRATLQGKRDFIPHVITTSIEHDAVLAPMRYLAAQGCELSYLEPNSQGFIDPDSFGSALRENTVFASVQMANNEVGSIQSIRQLAALAHARGVVFHTDAVQALGRTPVILKELGVDAASFSAHKIGGPKGQGALYLKNGTPFDPFIIGGGQESGKRSGTQNVCGAVGFAAACETAITLQEQESRRLGVMRDALYEATAELKRVHASVDVEAGSLDFLPNIVNLYVDGMESETLILRLDMQGFEVSGGSACSSHSLEPSHVLKALGLSSDRALGSLRISMGRYTDQEDIDRFLLALGQSIGQEEE